MPDSTMSFSVPDGVTDEQAFAELRRLHLASAKGRARRIVSIDGPPGRRRWRITPDGPVSLRQSGLSWRRIAWAAKVARSYVAMWLTVASRATINRGHVRREMARLDAAIAKATGADS